MSPVADSQSSRSGLVPSPLKSLSVAGVPMGLLSVGEAELELVGRRTRRSSRMDAVDGLNNFRDTRFWGRGTRGNDGSTGISCSDERESERVRSVSSRGESAWIGRVVWTCCRDWSDRESDSSSWSFIWRGESRKRLVTNQPTATGIAAIKSAWKAERTTSIASAGYSGGIQTEMRGKIKDEGSGGNSGWTPISEFQLGYPTANAQHVSPPPSITASSLRNH